MTALVQLLLSSEKLNDHDLTFTVKTGFPYWLRDRQWLNKTTPRSRNLWLIFLPWLYVCTDVKKIPCTSLVSAEFDPFGLTEHVYKTFGTSCGYWTFCLLDCSEQEQEQEQEQEVNSVYLTGSDGLFACRKQHRSARVASSFFCGGKEVLFK